MKHLESEKFNMLDLMGNIPELQSLFRYSQRGSTLYKIDSTNANELSFSVNILDRLHMTSERFSRYIESICSTYPCNMSPGKRAHPIYFYGSYPIVESYI